MLASKIKIVNFSQFCYSSVRIEENIFLRCKISTIAFGFCYKIDTGAECISVICREKKEIMKWKDYEMARYQKRHSGKWT